MAGLLSGSADGHYTPPRADDVMTIETDVAIVGAGVAGLAAAAALRARGVRCELLESAPRIGGRAYTANPAPLGFVPVEAGATWLHAAERNPLVSIARAQGVTLRDSDAARAWRLFVGGRLATADEARAHAAAQARYAELASAAAQAAEDTDMATAAAALRGDPWTATVETWETTLIAAADPRDFSVRDWHANLLEGGNLVPQGGLGAFVSGTLGPPAGPVRLATPVRRIAWGDGVAVATDVGTLRAQGCIVTVSTGVLAAGGIAFDPRLPASHADAVAGLPMGLLTKVVLRASGADRLDLPSSCGLQRQVPHRLAPTMSFLAWPFGADHITGFVGGPAAWDLSREGPAATEAFAREQLRGLFGSRADAALGAAFVADWAVDRWHRGAYAYAKPGCAGARAALGVPLAEGRLVFAGEACRTDGLAGTVGGAYLDGLRAAAAVKVGRA
jgi:monoamine oxidase